MTLTVYSITPVIPLSPTNDALAYALDRFLPAIEQHELDYIRERLRERGRDVLPLVREAPDLLAALEHAKALLEEYEVAATGETFNDLKIRAAIARAKGDA